MKQEISVSIPMFEGIFFGLVLVIIGVGIITGFVMKGAPDYRVISEIEKGQTNVTYTIQKKGETSFKILAENIPTLGEATNLLHFYIYSGRFPGESKTEYTYNLPKEP